jgi:hypothetical protein
MDYFYYTLGKWVFIVGGAALFFYSIIKLEKYLIARKHYKKMDFLEERFRSKDPTLSTVDLYDLQRSYDWLIEQIPDIKKKFQKNYEEFDKWLEEERNMKWAKTTFHFCSGYIVNSEGRKIRAMCQMHKTTKVQTNLKILEDGYWVSNGNLKAEDMVVERHDLTFLDNTETEIKTDEPNPIIKSQYCTHKPKPRGGLERDVEDKLDLLKRSEEIFDLNEQQDLDMSDRLGERLRNIKKVK